MNVGDPQASRTFSVVHRTEYQYGIAMSDGYTVAHLLPRDTDHQRVVMAEVHVTPDADEYDEHVDLFGNRVVRLGVHHPHRQLGVTARSTVEIRPQILPEVVLTWEEAARATRSARGALALEVSPFVAATVATPSIPAVQPFVDRAFPPGRQVIDAVRALCSEIHHGFAFDPGFSDVTTPIEAVVHARRGVCQDFAHLMLACLRMTGLAARYISGYVETLPPPGEVKLVGADASHAWCSVWIPGAGWCDVDPTNDQMPPDRHITVAWGRDYFDVTPVRGVVIGPASKQQLSVGVDVHRVG